MKSSSVPFLMKFNVSKSSNIEQQPKSFRRYDKNANIKSLTTFKVKNTEESPVQMPRNFSLGQNNGSKLKNFTKKQQISQSYVREFNTLRKASFLLNNRLTKPVFDITDAMMMGKPQPINTFRSVSRYSVENTIPSLKNAVKDITKKDKKSHIPKLYQRTLSVGNLSYSKDELNISKQKTFFPTTAFQSIIKLDEPQKKRQNKESSLQKSKNKLRRISSQISSSPKPSLKIHRLQQKVKQLKYHNSQMSKLMPQPTIKRQKSIVKGKGEIISQQKIIRVIDKLLSSMQLYFQMHGQNAVRVLSFIKSVEGFQNEKIQDILVLKGQLKRIKDKEEIMKNFWVFKGLIKHDDTSIATDKSQFGSSSRLPQFFGQEDYALYKALNNFVLKLQSKYQNHHKQKFTKTHQQDMQRTKKGLNEYSFVSENESAYQKKLPHKNRPAPYRQKNKSIRQISQRMNVQKNFFTQKIKFNPIVSDRKIFNQVEELQDLGVKFNIKQKGRSIILSERSKIIFNKR